MSNSEQNDLLQTKKCKQCGRTLPLISFRKYYPRGKGTYNTKQGYNTVCLDCERFNSKVNRIYYKKLHNEQLTKPEEQLLVTAKEIYKELVDTGRIPIGRFAKDCLGDALPIQASETLSVDAYKNMTIKASKPTISDLAVDQAIVNELLKLLDIPLVDEPEIYQDMFNKLDSKCRGDDRKVRVGYKDLYMQVAERLDNYEDAYWKEHK